MAPVLAPMPLGAPFARLVIGDIDAVKTRNPFLVNDIYLAQEMDLDINAMNNYGCSPIWGHPGDPPATA